MTSDPVLLEGRRGIEKRATNRKSANFQNKTLSKQTNHGGRDVPGVSDDCDALTVSAENCPSVLWCLYFNMADGSGLQAEGHDLPSNVHMCSGPDGGLSHEHAIRQVTCTHTQEVAFRSCDIIDDISFIE